MEGSSTVIVSHIHIWITINLERFDALKISQSAIVQKVLSGVHLSRSSLRETLISIDLEVMQSVLLTDRLAKLNSFGTIPVDV
jgi:hypothetical protein